MSNRLANENSPYLLQHAENPVDWYPWGEEALEAARRQDKPIFLSVGYAACHWCHVMAHESFEDPGTAAIMNAHFINIKVDREERPDIDSIYMRAVVAMTGQGGWPMSVFLTPQGEPFYGGTYFPPVRRYNMPAFRELLLSIADLWEHRRDKLLANSAALARHLQRAEENAGAGELTSETLAQALRTLERAYDWENGGWGGAPKFPQPMVIEFLLMQASRGHSTARQMAEHTLSAMSRGGMYDLIGGGFARYSVDDTWLVPHFEKMLYDNAQLALAYLHAHLLSGKKAFRQTCKHTLDFLLREMQHPEGGFYASLDADSEGGEGRYYLWTPEEVQRALGDPEAIRWATAAYGLDGAPNFEGAFILRRLRGDEELARLLGVPVSEVPSRLEAVRARLLEAREQRPRPATDDKVLLFWNALALRAFAEAGRYLGRQDYLAAAIRNADFLLTHLRSADRQLYRSWRAGRARHKAYLEDYAALILGLLALYQSDPRPRWFREARLLTQTMLSRFRDPRGGFYDTADDHEALLIRPKEVQDNATPSGNALAATALLLMASYTGEGAWRDEAEAMLRGQAARMSRYPTGWGQWLCAADYALGPELEIALLYPGDIQIARPLLDALWANYRPRMVVATAPFPPPPETPELLHDRPLKEGQATAYVCRRFACRMPVTTPEEMLTQIEDAA